MPFYRAIWMSAAPLLLSACATNYSAPHIAYSETLATQFQLDRLDKQRLQYFTSGSITLQQADAAARRGVFQGRLVERSMQDSDIITIPAGAPGVVVGSGEHWLAVSFSEGSYLYFVQANAPEIHAGSDDRYYLHTTQKNERLGRVRLNGSEYQVGPESMGVYLTVGKESLDRSLRRETVLPGRWLYPE